MFTKCDYDEKFGYLSISPPRNKIKMEVFFQPPLKKEFTVFKIQIEFKASENGSRVVIAYRTTKNNNEEEDVSDDPDLGLKFEISKSKSPFADEKKVFKRLDIGNQVNVFSSFGKLAEINILPYEIASVYLERQYQPVISSSFPADDTVVKSIRAETYLFSKKIQSKLIFDLVIDRKKGKIVVRHSSNIKYYDLYCNEYVGNLFVMRESFMFLPQNKESVSVLELKGSTTYTFDYSQPEYFLENNETPWFFSIQILSDLTVTIHIKSYVDPEKELFEL